jgi:hypothetical protein
MERESQFATQVRDRLGPTLSRCGFTAVRLKSCMQPEVLYRRGRLWFGASYDVRDQWLELKLGHLYWFLDVMPRVIILGDLSQYGIQCPKDGASTGQIHQFLAETAGDFERALSTYSTRYPEILERHLHPPPRKDSKEYLSCLRAEVQEDELRNYIE